MLYLLCSSLFENLWPVSLILGFRPPREKESVGGVTPPHIRAMMARNDWEGSRRPLHPPALQWLLGTVSTSAPTPFSCLLSAEESGTGE